MKNKINITLTVAILGILWSAYGTCYLNKVVLCVGNGDSAASFSKTCSGSGTVTFSYAVVADEAAYRFDVYSVTEGGLKTIDLNAANTYACDGISKNPNEFFSKPDSGLGFLAHYIDPCNGTRITGLNQGGGTFPFNVTFSSPFATSSACP